LEHIDKVIDIDQSPIGRTLQKSTYTGISGRNLFMTPEA
jgi:excinuclease UvrABC ATPase subunit